MKGMLKAILTIIRIMEVKDMRRFFYFLLFLLLLSGCGVIKTREQVLPEESAPTASASQQPETTEVPLPEQTPIAAPEPVLLGSAETELLDQTESRLHNINLAINSLNGFELEPSESFSFNRVVGERTPERGYEKATVIISTHLISDIEKVLDEVIFIKDGNIVLHESVDEIREREGKSVDELFREVFKC